jgi:hypothetical protein
MYIPRRRPSQRYAMTTMAGGRQVVMAVVVVALRSPVAAVAVARPRPHAAFDPPPPRWGPNWNLTQATVVQPGGGEANKANQTAGPGHYWTPAAGHTWGLVQIDSSIAACRTGAHADPDFGHPHHGNTTQCEAASRENCRRLKATGKATRCMIYHNFELALEWLESQRAAMYDPTKRDLFLQWPNGTLYSRGSYPDGIGMMLYWNYSNPAAGDYVVASILASVNGSDVDGTFTDDSGGGFPEHGYVAQDLQDAMNLTQFYHDSNQTYVRLVEALTDAGKTNWQSLSHGRGSGSMTRSLGGMSFRNTTCAAYMRGMCAQAKALPKRPLLFQGPCGESEKNGAVHCHQSPNHANQSVAAFLIVRPALAWIGDGWESDDVTWNAAYLLQPGTPVGDCKEGPLAVFTREWSNGVARLDCNVWSAELPFPSL